MEWRHLEEVLNRYGDLLCTKYKTYVPEGTGKLVQSVNYEVKVDGDSYIVGLNLEEYWKYVEKGRGAGKFPPLSKIQEWIKAKPVIPRPLASGKLPTEKQLAYLIGRKIAKEGTQGQHIMDKTIEEVNNEMLMSIKMAILEDLTEDIKPVLLLLNASK
jgi:hypothetical protein